MTEVSPRWLDSVVTASQRLAEARGLLFQLKKLTYHADIDHNEYFDAAVEVFDRDGVSIREEAMSVRILQVAVELAAAKKHGYTVGPILLALTEVIDTLQETVLNTEALLADARELQAQAVEDPFIDRLEEHPAYERN